MRKLTPGMASLVARAPIDWEPTPRGYIALLLRLEHRQLIELRPENPEGWSWRICPPETVKP